MAEHVADLPLEDAAELLLPHVWYDLDWQYSAPAAIAMHPQRDQLLWHLIRRAASSDQVPADLSEIDARWEFRGLLARIAAESHEDHWSPEVVRLIDHARVMLARSDRTDDFGWAVDWENSNRQVREMLLGLLAKETDGLAAARLVSTIIQLHSGEDDRLQARNSLLSLLARQTNAWEAEELVKAVLQLASTAKDERQVRQDLLRVLTHQNDIWVKQQLVYGLTRLASSSSQRDGTRQTVLELLDGLTNRAISERLVQMLVQLAPTAQEKRQACEALLGLLSDQANRLAIRELVDGLLQLAPTAQEKRQACEALLGLLSDQANRLAIPGLVGGLLELDATAHDRYRARQAIFEILARQIDEKVTDTGEKVTEQLLSVLAVLSPSENDSREVRKYLLKLINRRPRQRITQLLRLWVTRLDPEMSEGRLERQVEPELSYDQMVDEFGQQMPTWRRALPSQDNRKTRQKLLAVIGSQNDQKVVERLASGMVSLAMETEDKNEALEELLQLLGRQPDGWVAERLIGGVVQLATMTEDSKHAREVLLEFLSRQTDRRIAKRLIAGIVLLNPTTQDLTSWQAWAVPPTAELLSTVRRNSAPDDWLAALPSLSSLSEIQTES